MTAKDDKDPLAIPDFLRIPAEDRAAAWRNAVPVTTASDDYQSYWDRPKGWRDDPFFQHLYQAKHGKGTTPMTTATTEKTPKAAKSTKAAKVATTEKKGKAKAAEKEDNGVGRGVGIIATIVETISRDKGASIEELVAVLEKKFPDRKVEGMTSTAKIQANKNCSRKEKDEKRGLVYYKED